MSKWKDKCDDCGAMVNIVIADGPAYCTTHARKHGNKKFHGYTLNDFLDLSWYQRIIKYDKTGMWRKVFKEAGYTV